MSQQSGIYISNSSNFIEVPTPSGKNLAYFLNINDGNRLYAMRHDRSVFAVPVKAVDILDDFANDAAAAAGGIALGFLYHTAGAVKIRIV